MPENESVKTRVSLLAVGGATCLLASVAMFVYFSVTYDGTSGNETILATTITLVAAPILCIAALLAIARSGGRVYGKMFAVPAVILSSIVMALLASGLGTRKIVSEGVCINHLKGLANAILVYTQDNGENLPDPNRWCDLLIEKADVSPGLLVCEMSNTTRGESSYAMNRGVAGRRFDELPPDIVVFFDVAPDDNPPKRNVPYKSRQFVTDMNEGRTEWMVCRERWNQVCGLEKADTVTHDGRCGVLFGDMHIEYVGATRLPKLRWDLQPGEVTVGTSVPASDYLRDAGPSVLAAFLVWLAAVILWRCCKAGVLLVSTVLAVFSAIAGLLGGWLAELLYVGAVAGPAGGAAGAICGSFVGLWFVPFLKVRVARLQRKCDLPAYAVAAGMAAGVMASTVVHVVLMVYWDDAHNGLPVVAGLPFGIAAGAMLGGVTGIFLRVPAEGEEAKSDVSARLCQNGGECNLDKSL
jgi:hypothetical protein